MKTNKNKSYLRVECQVTGRFLQIEQESAILPKGEFLIIDVMADPNPDDGSIRKIVQLIVIKEELMLALNKTIPKIYV